MVYVIISTGDTHQEKINYILQHYFDDVPTLTFQPSQTTTESCIKYLTDKDMRGR